MLKNTPYHFDGHGINDCEGRRICKVSLEQWVYPDGYPERSKEFDQISKLMALMPDMIQNIKDVKMVIMSNPSLKYLTVEPWFVSLFQTLEKIHDLDG